MDVEGVCREALGLGWRGVGVPVRVGVEGLDVVRRVDLEPRNASGLLRELRAVRRRAELVHVRCGSKEVARQAGRDRRVDLVSFSPGGRFRYMDGQQANLMVETGAAYLLDLGLLLVGEGWRLAKMVRFLSRNAWEALDGGVPVVASSCARDRWGLRDPYGLVALLDLLGFDEGEGWRMVSEVPYGLVERNRAKLGRGFVEPGVWRVDPPGGG